MPAPKRYAKRVPDVAKIWEPAGYFKAQVRIWEVEAEARHELFNKPPANVLRQIKKALVLTPADIDELTIAKGHETNKLVRKVQSRLSVEAGNHIHEGNTSSDVLDTSTALQMKESLGILESDFSALGDSLGKLALTHIDTKQIARSHGQHAVPHTFGRQVVGWFAETKRAEERIRDADDVISVGKLSGEVGTNVFISPEVERLALEKLGLRVDEAPTQVISRDRHATVLALLAVNAGTLERIFTTVRLLARTDTGEVREPFEDGQQGSSAMPHKRNPELSERICGLARVVRAAALTELESQALWEERDISHSSAERFSFPDAFEALTYMVRLAKFVIDGLEVDKERMIENLNRTQGGIYSSRLLNALLEKGVARTDAYKLVQKITHKAIDQKLYAHDLAVEESGIVDVLGREKVNELFDVNFYLRNVRNAYEKTGLLKAI